MKLLDKMNTNFWRDVLIFGWVISSTLQHFVVIDNSEDISKLKTKCYNLQQQNDSLTQRFETLHKDVAKYVVMESENRKKMKAREIFNKSY